MLNTQTIRNTVNSFGYGYTLEVFATPGYRFADGSESTKIKCGRGGTWKGVKHATSLIKKNARLLVTVVLKNYISYNLEDLCPPLPNITHASHMSSTVNLSVGNTEAVVCEEGYHLGGGVTIRELICNLDLEWEGNLEPCTCKHILRENIWRSKIPLFHLISSSPLLRVTQPRSCNPQLNRQLFPIRCFRLV